MLTISSVHAVDPIQWPNSPWRLLQVPPLLSCHMFEIYFFCFLLCLGEHVCGNLISSLKKKNSFSFTGL